MLGVIERTSQDKLNGKRSRQECRIDQQIICWPQRKRMLSILIFIIIICMSNVVITSKLHTINELSINQLRFVSNSAHE